VGTGVFASTLEKHAPVAKNEKRSGLDRPALVLGSEEPDDPSLVFTCGGDRAFLKGCKREAQEAKTRVQARWRSRFFA
jgi:hypothetical protein